jgi:hypothetical protein
VTRIRNGGDEFIVGPGVQQAIDDAGDEARSDELYIILEDGHKVSQTFARDAIYYWIEEDGAVRRSPF